MKSVAAVNVTAVGAVTVTAVAAVTVTVAAVVSVTATVIISVALAVAAVDVAMLPIRIAITSYPFRTNQIKSLYE